MTARRGNRRRFNRCLPLVVLAAAGSPGLGIAGEADRERPFSVAAVLVHEQAFDRPHDVELAGELAFVPGKGGSIAIVDVSRPAAPRLIWHGHDGDRFHEAETVLPVGDRLFLGTDNLLAIDVRDPRRPVVEAEISTMPKIALINGMARRGEIVLAAGKNGVLAAFDVGTPAAPQVAGAVDIRRRHDVGWPHDVDLYAHYAVVADPQRFGRAQRPGKLALIQVFDAKTGKLLPAREWTLAGAAATDELIGANRVQVAGHYALVGASTRSEGGRLVVVDLSRPAQPRQVAAVPFAPQDGWGPNGLTVAGQVAFLAGGQSVEAIDIRRPEQPVKLAGQRFADVLANGSPRYAGGGDSGHDLVYRDGYLYVTGQNDHCLLILRVNSKRIRELAEQASPRATDQSPPPRAGQ